MAATLLRRLPLSARRAVLEDQLAGSDVLPARRLADDGLEAWKDVLRRGCEGMVAKPGASPYVAGAWRKVKVRHEGVFYVLGVVETEGRFGGVIVGSEAGDHLLSNTASRGEPSRRS